MTSVSTYVMFSLRCVFNRLRQCNAESGESCTILVNFLVSVISMYCVMYLHVSQDMATCYIALDICSYYIILGAHDTGTVRKKLKFIADSPEQNSQQPVYETPPSKYSAERILNILLQPDKKESVR